MHIKSQFSIKDLQNLTGIKAHTIRIWEKRYNLLEPDRTDTNIRKYDLESFKKLLNISFLNKNGYKISKIAALPEEDIVREIQKLSLENKEDYAIKEFKKAMFQFDMGIFNDAYEILIETYNFDTVFRKIFIPLLQNIGILWQIGTIDPIHESFISEAIKQKIILNKDLAQKRRSFYKNPTFALFLPHKEVHDIGLMYADYSLNAAGIKTIYLGSNIPTDNLQYLLKHEKNISFLTYLTIQPQDTTAIKFVKEFIDSTCMDNDCTLWVMGPKANDIDPNKIPSFIIPIKDFSEFDLNISTLKKS